ncbi:MAG TPA: hypothetical protein VNT26_02450 [Candidatus Sulfotelmatobacter sp.]|nr:hypothetical protein [Candidatus Sulfotelmatobacter sp.]
MNRMRKILLAAWLAAALGAVLFPTRRAALLREECRVLRHEQTNLATELARWRQQRNETTNSLALVEQENGRLKSGQLAAEVAQLRREAQRWREAARPLQTPWVRASASKVALLKEQLAQTPGAQIPEFRFLTPEDWLAAASGPLETEADFRRALAALRTAGERVFVGQLRQALDGYRRAHPDGFPTNLVELQPFFTTPADDALLEHWRVVPAEELYCVGQQGSKWLLTQQGPVDEEYDACFAVRADGDAQSTFKFQRTVRTLMPVFEAISRSNLSEKDFTTNGRPDFSALRSFTQTPEQKAALELFIQDFSPPP